MTLSNDIKNGILETIIEHGKKLWGDGSRVTPSIAGLFYYRHGSKDIGLVLLAMDQIKASEAYHGELSNTLVGAFRFQMRRQGMWLTDDNIEKAKQIKQEFEDKYYPNRPMTFGDIVKRSQGE